MPGVLLTHMGQALRDQAGQSSQTHKVWGQTGNIAEGSGLRVRPSG